ncbi:MAG: diguanylate cyclase [Nitrospinae bacterium]|nr:diguanylate cyclase [Nitrospinota bacterium]
MTESAYRILMVDDSEDDYLLTADLLEYTRQARFALTWASSFEAGLQSLTGHPFDAILVDFRMGPRSGFDFLSAAQAQGTEAPCIFLTGQQGHEIEMAALRQGAEDFLPKKDLSPSLLERTLLHAIERRRLLTEVSRSEARFRALFEESRIGMVILSRDGKAREMNGEAARLLPPLPTDRQADVGDLFPRDAEAARQAFASLGSTGAHSLNLRLDRTPEEWAQVTYCPVGSDERSRALDAPVVMIVRDVTREVILTRERDLLATFPRENPHPVLRIDIHGFCDYANRSANELLREWGIGQGLPTPSPLTLAAREVFEDGHARDIERTVGGRVFAFTLAPIKRFDRIYVYGRDITEQRQAVNRLRRAALVFDNTDDGVMITDGQGIIRTVNASFTRITGYSHDEAVGRTPAILKSERHDNDFYALLWGGLTEKGAWEGELWNRRKSGEIYLQHSRIRAVYDDGGGVSEFVSTFSDITGARMRAEELERRAYNDPLTGLPNRHLFHDRLGMAISRSNRSGNSFALMYLDLDGFKGVNDRGGHLAGDQTLQWVADRIAQSVRAEDTLARLGGDEFAVIVEAPADRAVVKGLTDRVHTHFVDGVPVGDVRFPVTVSIGVAFYPSDAQNRHDLVHRADAAMYCAKQQGKRTTCYAADCPDATE